MIDLTIIIVSYNTKEFLKKCLESVKNAALKFNYEIIVIDNNSSDSSLEMLGKEFPDVFLIKNKKNLGFSKANNQGIKKARGRYLLFLNPDTIVNKDTLPTLIEFMEGNKEVGVSTCKLIMPNGKIDDACHRGFPTPWNAFCHFLGISKIFPKIKLFSGYSLSYLDFDESHEIDACAGAFMLVRREAGEKIGWWDEDYFFYGEDLEFCFRLKELGYKIYYVPDVYTLHYKGISGGIKKISKNISTADKKTRRLATNARFNAMKIFYKKHYLEKYPKFITWLVMQGINFKLRTSLKMIN